MLNINVAFQIEQKQTKMFHMKHLPRKNYRLLENQAFLSRTAIIRYMETMEVTREGVAPHTPIIFENLSKDEQAAVTILKANGGGLSAYEIFVRIVDAALQKSQPRSGSMEKNLRANKAMMEYLFGSDTEPVIVYAEARKAKLGIDDFAKKLKDERSLDLPSYPTVRKICDDFVKIGWMGVEIRGVKRRYFLEKSTRKLL